MSAATWLILSSTTIVVALLSFIYGLDNTKAKKDEARRKLDNLKRFEEETRR
jgi:hypothetical protein